MTITADVNLGGAKRKNGHTSNCSCHICENMHNKAKRGGYEERKSNDPNKKNGHKMNCECPICKNMENAKKGGSSEEEYQEAGKKTGFSGGLDKKNGHQMNCKCPICKNMKMSKGGDGPKKIAEEEDISGGKKKCSCHMSKSKKGGTRRDKKSIRKTRKIRRTINRIRR